MVHQPTRREARRRHGTEVRQRHHSLARPVATVCRRLRQSLGLQLSGPARRLAGIQAAFYHLHAPDTADSAGADGIRVDRDGRLYVTTLMGIQVCDQAGRVNCIIPTPNGKVANLCFGGADFQTLFATCGERVYKRKVKVKGANAYDPPIKPDCAPPLTSARSRR